VGIVGGAPGCECGRHFHVDCPVAFRIALDCIGPILAGQVDDDVGASSVQKRISLFMRGRIETAMQKVGSAAEEVRVDVGRNSETHVLADYASRAEDDDFHVIGPL
jgi:hypothetical protein